MLVSLTSEGRNPSTWWASLYKLRDEIVSQFEFGYSQVCVCVGFSPFWPHLVQEYSSSYILASSKLFSNFIEDITRFKIK